MFRAVRHEGERAEDGGGEEKRVNVADQIWNRGCLTGRSQIEGEYVREILTPFIGPWVAICTDERGDVTDTECGCWGAEATRASSESKLDIKDGGRGA